ncbi:MAG: right-handed parallel beta-helix repeat-containing protein [Bacteroidales bacterium]|nr:right-handed parallel beta-helix repeat-containing protein [Bacteroidales bacterium]
MKTISLSLFIAGFLFLSQLLNVQIIKAQNCDILIENSQLVVDGADINPGDRICIEGGTRNYLLFRNLHGTADQPIEILNRGNVVIDTDHFYGLKMSNCRFIKIIGSQSDNQYGFTIRRVGNGAGISLDDMSSDIELAGFEISYTALGGIYAKTDPDCSFEATREKFTFYNLSIHDCYLHHIQDEGFYIGSSKFTGQYLPACDTTVLPHLLQNVLIYDNIVENTGWDGIQVSSSAGNCRIYNNKIYFDSQRETTYQMSGILIGGGSNCDCYNNQIFDGKGDGIDVFGSGPMKIYNNLIVRAGRSYKPNDPTASRHGIFIGNSPDQSISDNILIHNTIISSKTTGIRYFNTNTTYNLIANNIITDPGAYDIIGYKAYFDHQLADILYEEKTNIYTLNAGQIDFMDLQRDNYDLKATSIAVNTATDFGYSSPQFDNLMRPRPHNQGYDIGAFESQDPYASINERQKTIKNQLQLSPVPAKDFLLVKIANATENMQLKLFDQLGVCVYEDKNISFLQLNEGCKISLNGLFPGTYVINLQGETTLITDKIILQR